MQFHPISEMGYNKENMGVLTTLKKLQERNRLGELMVIKGALSTKDLKKALRLQKSDNKNLGRILVDHDFVTKRTLYSVLWQQWSFRALTAAVTLLLSLSLLGTKTARAGSIKDVSAKLSLTSAANNAFGDLNAYPALYGMDEKKSGDISPFTKWSSMFERFENDIEKRGNRSVIRGWQASLKSYQGLPMTDMIDQVNRFVNAQPYITDEEKWGKSDYWATPVEFFNNGGDCEDYAIAKYASLRALGVPENRMRVAIVQDLKKNIPHALLIVYTNNGPVALDNQSQKVLRIGNIINRYKPIFSINRTAWWLHVESSNTVVASAN